MMRLVSPLIVALLLLCAAAAKADYLEVTKPATLKHSPSSAADVLRRPALGATLTLLDDGLQSNGYYRVLTASGETGWIYRTLVRRHRGSAPGLSPVRVTTGPSQVTTPLAGDIMRVHTIDVGQGNAALIEFSCGVVMIDAGGQDESSTAKLIDYMTRFFEERPDLNRTISTIFITHTHKDHNLSLQKVVETFSVKNYVHNGGRDGSGRKAARWMFEHANDNGRQINFRAITRDEVVRASRATGLTDNVIDPVACSGTDPRLAVLHGPYEEDEAPTETLGEENNKSLVIRLDFGKATFLFTGDLEEAAIEEMVEFYEGTKTLDVDVYHVGHHGSHNGTTDSLMTAMTPKIALVSMGPHDFKKAWTAWAYGHPRKTIVELLDKWVDRSPSATRTVQIATGVKKFGSYELSGMIFGTGWDGTVVVAANANGQYAVNRSGRSNAAEPRS